MIGQTISHYRIKAQLGAGGMGEVYRATDTKLGREVALKVLPDEMARDPQRLARFQREARAVAALNHPHIVTIFSVEEAGGIHFFTMELVEGQSLNHCIPEHGLRVAQLAEFAIALAGALAAAHEKGIVHRDLKPANVMVSPEGRIKVLDFGLAKETRADLSAEATLSRAGQTEAGVVMGTPAYMSPEQIAGRPLDQRTDLFSLGIILYEMATGRRPFEGASSAELGSAILRDTPPLVTDLRPDLPGDLARIIRRCLEKDPRHRVQTALDVANEFRDLARQVSQAAAVVEPARSLARPPAADASGAARAEGGFWVAVLPFKCRGANAELEALAEGLTEEIVTGLARFSYLRVIARASTLRYSSESGDVRTIGKELAARYVMEGSLRQAGTKLRVAVQLVDAGTGAHLWAETYNRDLKLTDIFALQDDLTDRVVATVADSNGVLVRSMAASVEEKPESELTASDWMLRHFSYRRRLTPEEHAKLRDGLEGFVEREPRSATVWACLAQVYLDEFCFGFGRRPDELDRALAAARCSVDLDRTFQFGNQILAQVHFFRRDIPAFRTAAEQAMELNSRDTDTLAMMGLMLVHVREIERGASIVRRAMDLNPHHAGWFHFALLWEYFQKGNYENALEQVTRINMPGLFWQPLAAAACCGLAGRQAEAAAAVRELRKLDKDIELHARHYIECWHYSSGLMERILEGLSRAGLEIPAGTTGASATGPAPVPRTSPEAAVTIAVLPFSDMSPAQDQQYLCEGMAEEIMNALVRIAGIRVAARTSAFRARRQQKDLAAVARALKVGHVLEGSVRASGNRLRVTAQLTEVASGFQLWSERYERDAADVFAVQDEIAAGVVEAVKARLAPGERTVRARPQVGNLEAYRLYLKGRHLRYTKNDHGGALRCFEQATALDPSHGPSWVGLADVSILATGYGLKPAREAYATAKAALETATRLESETAESSYVAAMLAVGERRWKDAERASARALQLDPGHVQAHCWAANLHCLHGRMQGAMQALSRAREIDPLAPYPYAMTGLCLLQAKRPEEADRFVEQALAFDADNILALWVSGAAKTAQGLFDVAIAQLEHAVEVSHRGPFIHGTLGWALAAAGRADAARRVLEALRAQPAPATTVLSEAWILAALGDRESAFQLLDRACEEKQLLVVFHGLPGFDPLRGDTKFSAVLEKLGLPSLRAGETLS